MVSYNDRLDAAIDDLLAGQSSAADADLQPLLLAGARLLALDAPAPRTVTSRMRMQAALRVERERRGGFWRIHQWGWLRHRRLALLAASLALLAIIWLSGNALPGQAHYTLKRGIETLPLLIARQPDAVARYHVALASRRLDELEHLLVAGHPIPASLLDAVAESWDSAASAAGADRTLLREQAGLQSARLQQILPFLPAGAKGAAEGALAAIRRAGAEPPPSPVPSILPTPTLPPPTATATPEPSAAVSDTPRPPTSDREVTPAVVATATPQPSPTVPSPTPPAVRANPTPGATLPAEDDDPTQEPDDTPEPTSISSPAPTSTLKPTATPSSDDTPEPDESPEPEDTPQADETPESDDTPEPEASPDL